MRIFMLQKTAMKIKDHSQKIGSYCMFFSCGLRAYRDEFLCKLGAEEKWYSELPDVKTIKASPITTLGFVPIKSTFD